MVSRRVNAILEATPMHLITSYFEHAYEMPMGDEDEDGFVTNREQRCGDETIDKLEALLGHPDLLASGDMGGPTIPGVDSWLTSAQTAHGREEDPSEVLARVREMARAKEASEERLDLTAPPSAQRPSSQGEPEAASMLGRAQAMPANPQAPCTEPLAPPCSPQAEDARVVLARVQAMLEDPAPASSTAPLARYLPPEHGHLPPCASLAHADEDASQVLARVQEWMREPRAYQSGTPMSMPAASAPHAGPALASATRADDAREDAASVLARANDWLRLGAIPDDRSVDRGMGGRAGRNNAEGGADVLFNRHAIPGPWALVQTVQSVACTCADSVASAACACASSGALVQPASGAAAREDPAQVLARVRGMVADNAVDTSPADRASPAAARPRLWTKPGQWAWERTPDTCCAWEKRLVMQAVFEQ